MRTILKNHTIRRGLLFYRKIRYRKGFGVHSPFVFKLITQVIEEKCSYYSYEDIALIRKKLLYSKEILQLPAYSGKTIPVDQLIRKYDLKAREGELLFRLANFFKPAYILQIAPSEFFSTVYLSAYSDKVKTYIIQNQPCLCSLSAKMLPLVTGKETEIWEGKPEGVLPEVLSDIPAVDMIYLDDIVSGESFEKIWEQIMAGKRPETVFILRGPHQNRIKKSFWKSVCEHPDTTVTMDLYSYGIALFTRKFHKRSYKVYFKN